MLKIRLTRTGKKNEAHFRIIVCEQRSKTKGQAIEFIGYHNPRIKKTDLNIERAKYWLSVGAKPSETVHSIFARHKLLEKIPRPKRDPLKSKKALAQEAKEKPAESTKKPEENKTEVKDETSKAEEQKTEIKAEEKAESKPEKAEKSEKEKKTENTEEDSKPAEKKEEPKKEEPAEK